MSQKETTSDFDRELLTLLGEISSGLRCCRQDVFNCEGLGLSQFLILDRAAGQTELPLAELHQMLDLEKSTVTRLVAPMVTRGLLSRRKSQGDGRAATLVITDEGRVALGKVWDCVRGFLGGVLAAIPQNRRGEMLSCLKDFALALRRGAQAAESGAPPQPVDQLGK